MRTFPRNDTLPKPDVRRKVGAAIEAWYSSTAWHSGVRLTGVERIALADYIARRLGA